MKRKILLPLLFFLALACNPKAPQNIQPSKYTCSHCIMQIMDMRFHAQVQTTKGKIFHFDSIECMINWIHANSSTQVETAWVRDYSTGEWILAENAYFLVSPNLPSPMGAYLSSFKTQVQTEEILKIKGGKIYKYEELWNYLKNLESKHH